MHKNKEYNSATIDILHIMWYNKNKRSKKMLTLFVTAGAKNTGLAIAEKFAQNGFDIAFTARRPEEITKAERQIN